MVLPATSILFVCLGNICRSPLAEGIFRQVAIEHGMADRIHTDSAGTGGWHVGSPPDSRSVEVAARYGIDISGQRCRKIRQEDFDSFDLILGMDRSNIDNLNAIAPRDTRNINLFLNYAQGVSVEVPDPYYGGPDGFDSVYHMIRDGSEALVSKLKSS